MRSIIAAMGALSVVLAGVPVSAQDDPDTEWCQGLIDFAEVRHGLQLGRRARTTLLAACVNYRDVTAEVPIAPLGFDDLQRQLGSRLDRVAELLHTGATVAEVQTAIDPTQEWLGRQDAVGCARGTLEDADFVLRHIEAHIADGLSASEAETFATAVWDILFDMSELGDHPCIQE